MPRVTPTGGHGTAPPTQGIRTTYGSGRVREFGHDRVSGSRHGSAEGELLLRTKGGSRDVGAQQQPTQEPALGGQLFRELLDHPVRDLGNPLLRLKRVAPKGLFDAYAASMDAVWRTARPLKE